MSMWMRQQRPKATTRRNIQWPNCQLSENRSSLPASDLQRVSSHVVLAYMIDSSPVDASISVGHPSRRLCFPCPLSLIDGSKDSTLRRLTLKLNSTASASLRTSTHQFILIYTNLGICMKHAGALRVTIHSIFNECIHQSGSASSLHLITGPVSIADDHRSSQWEWVMNCNVNKTKLTASSVCLPPPSPHLPNWIWLTPSVCASHFVCIFREILIYNHLKCMNILYHILYLLKLARQKQIIFIWNFCVFYILL